MTSFLDESYDTIQKKEIFRFLFAHEHLFVYGLPDEFHDFLCNFVFELY